MKENNALIRYSTNNVISIFAMFSKLIPAPPDNLLIIPVYTSVVAFPNILGPTIVNIVLATAKIRTIAIGSL